MNRVGWMVALCPLFACVLLAQGSPFPNGQVNPLLPNSPVRDATRLNVGGSNPSSSNAQSGITIANRGKTYAAVWAEQNGTSDVRQDVWFSRSDDGGLNWTLPVRVDVADPPNTTDSDYPHLVFVDKPQPVPGLPPYNIVVAFETTFGYGQTAALDDVGVAVSTDNGSSFQLANPYLVNAGAGLIGSDIDEIWMAAAGTNVYIVWEEDGQTDPMLCPGGSESLFFTRSLDGGLTFEPPQIINNVILSNPLDPCSNNDVNNPMVVAKGNDVWVSYTDNGLGMGDDVHVATSAMAGAPGSWSSQSIESQLAGDVNNPRIAISPALVGGATVVAVAWEDDDPGQYVIHLSISGDNGQNWGPEIVVSPNVLGVGGAGVSSDYDAYHRVAVAPDGRICVIWLDDHEAPSLGQNPGAGNASGARQLYFSSFDIGGSVLVPTTSMDPGRANQFPDLATDGDTIFVHYEVKPFGNNDLNYGISIDGGITWKHFLVPSTVVGDVDSPDYQYRQGPHLAADFETLTAVSVFWTNPLGRNEVYTAGVRIPYIERVDDVGGLSTVGIDGVPLASPGSVFQVVLSATGIYPVIPLGNNYVPLILDGLSLDSLGPLLPFLTGPVGSDGRGRATLSFPTPAGSLGIYGAAAIVRPGAPLLLTDGFFF
jgi:hypothetical protein